jgi:hypothetical protein
MSADEYSEQSSAVMWRLLPTDVSFSTVYVLQLRHPEPEDVRLLKGLGWTTALLDTQAHGRHYLLATTDVDVALSSGFTEEQWLDSKVITV